MTYPLAADVDPLAASIKSSLDERTREAQNLWTQFEDARKRELEPYVAEGKAIPQDKLTRLDDMKKAYEAVADEAKDLRERWERHVIGRAGDGVTFGDGKARDGSESIGAAFLKRLGAGSLGLKALDATTGGSAVPPFFDRGIRALPVRKLFVRSVIPVRPLTSDKVWYVRQTVHTNAATAVAAGGLKPTSIYTVERIEDTVRTIAHVTEAMDRALLADFQDLVDFIDGQLRLGVLLAEESQIINGNGTAPNLRGILNTAGIATQPRGTDSRADAVHKAITTIRNSFYEPDAIVLHPNDWQTLVLEKSGNADYYFGGPAAEDDLQRLWGKQVVTSPVIAQGTGLVGAFAVGCTLWDREQARVTFTESGARPSDGLEMFTRNQLLFRGEERIAFGVERPAAFCQVTGL